MKTFSIKNVLLLAIISVFLLPSVYGQREDCVFKKKNIKSVMLKTAKWQLNHPTEHDPRHWTNGAFYAGIYAAWETTKDKTLYKAMMDMGEKVNWTPYRRWYHADDIAICQTYIDLYKKEKKEKMILPTIDRLQLYISKPYPGKVKFDIIKYWWCDALFMAPPTLVKLGILTGNKELLEANDNYFKECYDLLYNKEEHLFARDLRFVIKGDEEDKWEANGKKVFWSRGNGWVMGGLVRILKELPQNYEFRPFYENLYKEMANRIVSLQHDDGLWRTSLLDPDSYEKGESSGSAFFCYALAWGINNGLLDEKTFLPAVRKSWKALVSNVNDEGRLGWVQQVDEKPNKNLDKDSWHAYGTGAFLLAGSEVIKLK